MGVCEHGHLLKVLWDFPGGPVVKNPPSNAGDVGSIPCRGTKIPRAAGQLNMLAATREKPCTATTEPACCRACALQLLSLHATTREPTRHN